jgi:hypothetical protein
MSQQDATDYVKFYQRQAERTERLNRQALGIVVGVAIVLFLLVIGLGSPLYVVAWVAAVYAFTFFGTHRLRRALVVTKTALDHFMKFAEFLSQPHDRRSFQEFVSKHIDPDDDSNVPESISTLCTGQISGENIRAASNRAFAIPASELAVAQYRRTALILSGLFGTVLFFAIELGGSQFLSGDLSVLLPGLRGALASTLTGILGSLTLGFIASSIDRTIEQAVWESEAFLGGPVATTLAMTGTETPIVNETELWAALRKEVAQLREETVLAYSKLANDANTYGKSLEVVSQQIAQVPAVHVPPQLARLDDVVSRFAHGVEVLDKTASGLIEAVGSLGVFAPAKTLQQLDQLTSIVRQNGNRASTEAESIASTIATARGEIGALHRDMLATSAGTRDDVRVVGETCRSLEPRIDSLRIGVLSLEKTTVDTGEGFTKFADQMAPVPESISTIGEAFTALAARLEMSRDSSVREPASGDTRTNDDVRLADGSGTTTAASQRSRSRSDQPVDLALYEELHELRVNVESVPTSLAKTNEQVSLTARRVQSLDESLSDPDHGLRSTVERINNKVDRLSQQQHGLDDLVSRMSGIENVLRWHERAARAPLMRLLLLPFRTARNGEADHHAT